MNVVLLALALLALSFAWYLGYRMQHPRDSLAQKTNLPRAYLDGLNFLLNEETDKAVDSFIKMLEVDSDTVETHLAVGKLFRRRGEVERALRIHQNLIARPQLEKAARELALFELGQDYLSAGMLDRAERIFLEIVSVKEHHILALRALLDIYQQEKSWQNAIQIAYKLEAASKNNLQDVVAHYYCELAESILQHNQQEMAEQYLKRAIDADRQCARASLLQAKLDMERQNYKSALRNLKYIKAQNPDYLSEAIEPLAECYEKLNEQDKLVAYLKQLLEEYPHIPVVLILADRIRKWRGDKVAAGFVADYVRRYPSLRGVQLFINIYISNAEGRAKED
ncbi:MAG TPA: lipopolysaccharide assembly protein LapB, partial [Gammaproteobacteria bacterium]|nr:lipopolysaccharide assembly protein LapB [Gammaproteobacteria bacterium]